tara:strand:+ start:132 stop:479 length:348 start_codon:yes stop_codon:yes gene_type:complete
VYGDAVRKLRMAGCLNEKKNDRRKKIFALKFFSMVVPFFVLFVVIVPRMPFPENLVFGGIMIIFVLGAVLGIPAIEERRLRTFNFGEKKKLCLPRSLHYQRPVSLQSNLTLNIEL